ncbi:aminoglycoside phosphotransferase family protein [Nocardioides sp. KC13]|uniref:Aminoglycoside phosphotransferase family protein n=1 Tax=Nocardioides turkmenicus TaxID=2711220 RepID=A0A6M1QX06_9ACTN|nr:aminoglycoside phosphotransferase family protein [Nocardioides sp. KC13]NGN94515.1 aminoglycoside phosphotransferase family protein [Nocardioides sp. KC13]
MTSALDTLTPTQRDLLDQWLPGAELVSDRSELHRAGTTALVLASGEDRFLVKTTTEGVRHIDRELAAFRSWLAPWSEAGRAPSLVEADRNARIIVMTHLDGEPATTSAAVHDPEIYRQAGELLATFHGQASVEDEDYEAELNERAAGWLDDAGLDAELTERLREDLDGWEAPVTVLRPSHGDWQPSSWVLDGGTLRVVDTGRFGFRPALYDLGRLSSHDFTRNDAFEKAFLDGYGSDPREPEAWHRLRVRDALSVARWAHRTGHAEVSALSAETLVGLLEK